MSRKRGKKLLGICHFFFETGTEGGHWAFQDKKHTQVIDGEERWSYAGLHILEDGDELTIYDKNDHKKIIWSGIIHLKFYPVFTESAYNFWIHSDQFGVERNVWAKWFINEYPAKLVKAKNKKLP